MPRLTRKLMLTLAAITAGAMLAGCSTTSGSIDSGEKLAKASNGADAVIFGKFRLIRNGREARLDDGFFASTAVLHVSDGNGGKEIIGKVGKDGEFAWVLAPGDYKISTIGFDNRGERETTSANLALTVPNGHKAVYVGTITLEASFDSGYYGTNGSVDNFFITNDCASDCAARLQALGLASGDMSVSVLETQYRLARTN